MIKTDFSYLDNFSSSEAWGNLSLVQWHHVHHLQLIRSALKKYGYDWPMIIHCCYESSGHSENSYHYMGLASDFHFKSNFPFYNQVVTLETALHDLNLAGFMGLGAYPYWYNPGFHLDSRGYGSRWMRTDGKDSAIDMSFLRGMR